MIDDIHMYVLVNVVTKENQKVTLKKSQRTTEKLVM